FLSQIKFPTIASLDSLVPSSVSSTGSMDGTMHAPSGAEPRVAAHSSVNGNGAARRLHDEWLEEYEAGVFMKLKDLGDGTRELKRVRFSKRRFGEHQAENWWKENREKVYERYNIRTSQRASSAAPTHSA
uniref:BRX domain-containing protein n=3 Tax=Aegilops tauschii subsp. strangulata TaxID=200361 RepID=A0A452XKP8_AEGTS